MTVYCVRQLGNRSNNSCYKANNRKFILFTSEKVVSQNMFRYKIQLDRLVLNLALVNKILWYPSSIYSWGTRNHLRGLNICPESFPNIEISYQIKYVTTVHTLQRYTHTTKCKPNLMSRTLYELIMKICKLAHNVLW